MEARLFIQSPSTPEGKSLQAHVAACVSKEKFDFVRTAAAYATVSGVRSLLAAFDGHELKKSQWLIGLDDAITQPGAIDLLLTLKNGEVRVASFEKNGRRFHPKLYAFAHTDADNSIATLIGSANLTARAFYGNSEAVALLECKDKKDKADVNSAWDQLWSQGHKPSADELNEYADRYKKAAAIYNEYQKVVKQKAAKAPLPKSKPAAVLASDDAEIDPTIANICWIECGNVTAMGRELELKAEQGLFFGLSPAGGKSKSIPILASDGSNVSLRMKYQGNHMWRLQMTNAIPEVKVGLRPTTKAGKLGRSPYVAVFERLPGKKETKLKFITLGSKDFTALRARTLKSGTLGETTAREYGWCQ